MSDMEPKQVYSREESLDGVRLILTVLVIVAHSAAMYPAVLQELIHRGGSFRIPALYALSGFVLYLPTAHLSAVTLNYGAREFWKRRAFRLLPAYWVMLLFASLRCLYVAYKNTDPVERATQFSYVWKGLLWHIPLLHGFSGDAGIIVTPDHNVSWTLAFECVLSAALPLILFSISRLGWWPVWAIVLFLNTPQGISLKLMGGRLPDIVPSGFLLVFVCGITFARLSRNASLASNGRFAYGALAGVVLLFLSRLFYLPLYEAFAAGQMGPSPRWGVVLAYIPSADFCLVGLAVSAFCCFLVQRPSSLTAKWLKIRPIRVSAPISYGLYLVHVPLFATWNMVAHRLHVPPVGIVSLIMTWILVIGAAVLLHRTIEVPFQRLGKSGSRR